MSYSIEVNNISKKFRRYLDKKNTLKERVIRLGKQQGVNEDWILRNINLLIKEGQTVGLVGRNGSGKSTLLKLMTRILHPNEGKLTIRGRVSSLLELGAGFHPDFTGIENIYMNAAILGLSKKEIDSKLSEIIAFSELKDYIYQPVRIYSSGMYMRLAFSVAISVDPDILLIDEVLAVGDNAFQNKCIEKIKELKGQGKTIVIVTHDNSMVEKICDRAVWLHNGKIKADGLPRDVIMQYMAFLAEEENKRLVEEHSGHKDEVETVTQESSTSLPNTTNNTVNSQQNRVGNKDVEIIDVWFSDKENTTMKSFVTGQSMNVNIQYKINKSRKSIVFGVGFFTSDNICCYGTNTHIDRSIQSNDNIPKEGVVQFKINKLMLLPGYYNLDVAVHHENGEPYDYLTHFYSFQISSSVSDAGIVRLDHSWELKGKDEGEYEDRN